MDLLLSLKEYNQNKKINDSVKTQSSKKTNTAGLIGYKKFFFDLTKPSHSINLMNIQFHKNNQKLMKLIADGGVKPFQIQVSLYDMGNKYPNYQLAIPYLGTYHGDFHIYNRKAFQINKIVWNILFPTINSNIDQNYIIIQQRSPYVKDHKNPKLIKIKPHVWTYYRLSPKDNTEYKYIPDRQWKQPVKTYTYFLNNTIKRANKNLTQYEENAHVHIHYSKIQFNKNLNKNEGGSVLYSPHPPFNYHFNEDNEVKIFVSNIKCKGAECNVLFILLDFKNFNIRNYDLLFDNLEKYINTSEFNFEINGTLLFSILKNIKN